MLEHPLRGRKNCVMMGPTGGSEMKAYLTVGEMGQMFGLNVQTLHYYDKIGLFCP